MMKKLLSISPHMSTGGAPQVLVKRVELINEDLEIYVVEFNNYSNDFIIQRNRLQRLLKPGHYFILGENKFELLNIINKIQPDYIHFEEMPELFNIDYKICKEIYKPNRKYKIFETTHSSDFNVDDKIFFPDKFLFVSQYNCYKFNKFGIPTEVIEYPVEKRKRDPERKKILMSKLGLDPNYKHVVNVGLFTPRKNQAYAFDIAKRLSREKIKFHFIGNQADNFKSYWEPLLKNKPDNCILWNERDDVDDFLDACDLFLFTSMGFRWNKELNPLVIKEALEHQIPQFLFPLDVYNGKYDKEYTINYLNGDPNVDSKLIKNFLFERENLPWHKGTPRYKIRAVHLLLEEDDRSAESIKELQKLRDYGIDYIQHINKRYTNTPPREFCARPNDVGRIGAYSLRGPHYGNYQSFKNALLTETTDDIDFIMIFESDCKLNVPIHEFVDKIFKSCDYIINRGIYYMSFGDNRNLRTGELVSENKEQINDWMYITNKIIGIQSIMFPKFAFDFIKRSYQTILWDVTDLMYIDMFKYKLKAIAPGLTTQIEGISTIQGEKINHFLLKNEDNLIHDKNPNDIIVEYNKDDDKFHFCLSDFYQKDISDLSIVVNADNIKNIYKTNNTTLSPMYPMWIQIYEQSKYNEFIFDFYYKDKYIFSKNIKMKSMDENITNNEEQIKLEPVIEIKNEKKLKIEDNINKEEAQPISSDFKIEYKIDENRIYIFSSNNIKKYLFDVELRDIETDVIIYRSNDLIFDSSYSVWLSPGMDYYKNDPKFIGYKVLFIKDDEIKFEKDLILREKVIDIDFEEIHKSENKYDYIQNNDYAFLILTYPDTKLKEDITKKCIDSIKPSGNKIILSSHYPVSKELQSSVDYYLYDAYNPLIQHTLYNFYWSTIPDGKAEINLNQLQDKNNLNQSLTVYNNIDNSIKFAHKIGIKNIICVSYDFIFNENNLIQIKELCNQIEMSNKKGYFMEFNENDMKLYKSVFFIINTDFYRNIFDKLIRTPEEYNESCKEIGSHNFLENYYYSKLSKYSDLLLIEQTDEDKLFQNNNINLFSGVEYITLLPIKDKLFEFVLWFNSSNNKDNRRIEFEFNNNGIIENSTHFIKNRSYYMRKFKLEDGDNYTIKADYIDSDTNTVMKTKIFNINKSTFNNIMNNGIFTEK